MRFASAAIARNPDARTAGREVAERAATGLGGQPEAGLLFASPDYPDLQRLLAAASDVLGTSRIVGGTASAVLGMGEDAEQVPAVSLLILAGSGIELFGVADVNGREKQTGADIAGQLGGRPRASDLAVLVHDATRVSARPLVTSVQEALEPACLVGAGTAGGALSAPAQWLNARSIRGGAVGLLIRGARPPRIRIAQACRPVTGNLTITQASGYWIQSIDGRPALEVYREVARGPLARDLRRAAAHLMVALPSPGPGALTEGRYRTRRVVGFSEERGAFAVPESMGRGQEIALVLRDPEGAREELGRALEGLGEQPERSAALYFNCAARGRALFGVSGLEAGYLERALAGLPWAGMHGPSQIAPLGARTECLTHAGVLAVF